MNSHVRKGSQERGYEVVGELTVRHHHYVVAVRSAAQVRDEPPADGNCPVCRFELAGELCAVFQDGGPPAPAGGDPLELLTERELQIVTLIGAGRLNKQIAAQLHISEWTVATHVRRMFAKLSVRTRAALASRCAALLGRPSEE